MPPVQWPYDKVSIDNIVEGNESLQQGKVGDGEEEGNQSKKRQLSRERAEKEDFGKVVKELQGRKKQRTGEGALCMYHGGIPMWKPS